MMMNNTVNISPLSERVNEKKNNAKEPSKRAIIQSNIEFILSDNLPAAGEINTNITEYIKMINPVSFA